MGRCSTEISPKAVKMTYIVFMVAIGILCLVEMVLFARTIQARLFIEEMNSFKEAHRLYIAYTILTLDFIILVLLVVVGTVYKFDWSETAIQITLIVTAVLAFIALLIIATPHRNFFRLYKHMKDNIKNSENNQALYDSFNKVQKKLTCCGDISTVKWYETAKHSDQTLPTGCCMKTNKDNKCTIDNAHPNPCYIEIVAEMIKFEFGTFLANLLILGFHFVVMIALGWYYFRNTEIPDV